MKEALSKDNSSLGKPIAPAPEASPGDQNFQNIMQTNVNKIVQKGPIVGLVTGMPSFVEGYNDPDKIAKSPAEQMEAMGGGTKATIYQGISPLVMVEDIVKNASQEAHHDPDKSDFTKGMLKTAHGAYFIANRTIFAPLTLVGEFGRLATSLFDEDEGMTIDPVTGETAGNSDEKHIPPFPFWDVAEPTTETEAVGYPRGLFPLPDFSDQSAVVDEQQNGQVDAVTGYSLNNDDAAGFDWFQMHHDDGIMDGYLDTAETEFCWMTAEPIEELTITEFPEFLPGQTITFDESGMDGLVAAGPFDAVALNEPQNNNVF